MFVGSKTILEENKKMCLTWNSYGNAVREQVGGNKNLIVKGLVGSLPPVPREGIRRAAAHLRSTPVSGREPKACMPRPRWRRLVGAEQQSVLGCSHSEKKVPVSQWTVAVLSAGCPLRI